MAKKTKFVNPLFRKYPELSDGRAPTRKSSKDDQRRGAQGRRTPGEGTACESGHRVTSCERVAACCCLYSATQSPSFLVT